MAFHENNFTCRHTHIHTHWTETFVNVTFWFIIIYTNVCICNVSICNEGATKGAGWFVRFCFYSTLNSLRVRPTRYIPLPPFSLYLFKAYSKIFTLVLWARLHESVFRLESERVVCVCAFMWACKRACNWLTFAFYESDVVVVVVVVVLDSRFQTNCTFIVTKFMVWVLYAIHKLQQQTRFCARSWWLAS